MLNKILATTLETQLNQALHWDQSSLEVLNKLSGKIIRIELSGFDLNFTLFPDNQGVIVLSDYNGEVDVRMSSAPFTLLRLLVQQEVTLSNNPDITITGDIDIAQQLLQLLRELNIDWEEQLAQHLGEVPTHKLGTLIKQCQTQSRDSLNHFVPSRVEMETFFKAIEILRRDIERLEQRVERLA